MVAVWGMLKQFPVKVRNQLHNQQPADVHKQPPAQTIPCENQTKSVSEFFHIHRRLKMRSVTSNMKRPSRIRQSV